METQSIEKSQRINLGARNVKFSDDAIKKLNYLLGTLFIGMSVLYFFRDNAGIAEKVVFCSAYFIMGLFFLFIKARIELSPTSKYAPHFLVSENGLKIKTGVLKKSQFIDWNDVKKIELGYYKIGIKDQTGLQFYPYQTRKETSIKIKRAIEDIAAQKGIEVENLLKK
ncbi:hypothetical protein ABWH96_20840 [Marivirga tractuosa]|uniref:hypothetical protein n=1 Tax=Marivirga tractuosa TaxID=1006 RepID=UPI0035D0E2B1